MRFFKHLQRFFQDDKPRLPVPRRDDRFRHLNPYWNADPNVPLPHVTQKAGALHVSFWPNIYAYAWPDREEQLMLRFADASKYRMTMINDHGWYLGQCRFSWIAPRWGEFYEITGDSQDDEDETPWVHLTGTGQRHFHFYFREETLEVKARDWSLMPAPPKA